MKVKLITTSFLLGSILFATDSIYDGTGSLVNPSQKDGCWGCDKDEAKMQPHQNKTSTVTFQTLRDEMRCNHVDISTNIALNQNVIINLKRWNGEGKPKTFKATLPTRNFDRDNGISIDNTLYDWTTIAISTTKPLDEEVAVYAYCRYEGATLSTDSLIDISSQHTKLSDEYYHLGNASLITRSTDNGEKDFGIKKDVSIASKIMNSVNTFQVYNYNECKRVILTNGSGIDNDIQNISIKGWNEPKWSEVGCLSLPCTINTLLSENDKATYTLIKIQTKANSSNGRIYAHCLNEDTKIELNEKASKPKNDRNCEFDDVSESNWGYKYITALCSAQIVEGYKPYYLFKPEKQANWAELTKVVNLADNFYKTQNIQREYNYSCLYGNDGECWYEPYVNIAKQQGFSNNPSMLLKRGVAFKYVVSIFWNKSLSESDSANWLYTKGVINNINTTNNFTRQEMAKVVLNSARISADDSGLDRKLPYINHIEDKLDDKGDIPREIFKKTDLKDTIEEKKNVINQNIKTVQKNNITLSTKDTTDNLSLTKQIIDIKDDYKDKSADEIIDDLKSNKFTKVVDNSHKIEANSIVELLDTKTSETILAVTSTQKDEKGNAKIILEISSNRIETITKEDLEKENFDIKSQTPNEYMLDDKDEYTPPPPPPSDTTKPTGYISGTKNITQGNSGFYITLSANDNKALSSMKLTVQKSGSSTILEQPFTISGTSATKSYKLNTSSYSVGSYIIKLVVTDKAGNSNYVATSIDVSAPTPPSDTTKPTAVILDLSTTILQGEDTEYVTLDAYDNKELASRIFTVQKEGSSTLLINQSWNLSGTNSRYGFSIPIINYSAGRYICILKVTDKAGNYNEDTKIFTIEALPLTPPINVRASDGIYTNNIKINWNSVNGATEYYVYRSTTETGSYSTLVDRTTKSYTFDTDVDVRNRYYYKVKAYNSSTGKKSDYSDFDKGWIKFNPPSNVRATDGTYSDKIKITWNGVEHANQYYILKATSENGSYSEIAHTNALYFDDKNINIGSKYYYKIRTENYSITRATSDESNFNSGYAESSSANNVVIESARPSVLEKGQVGRYLKIYGINMDKVIKIHIPGVVTLTEGSDDFYKCPEYVSVRIAEVYGSGGDVPLGDRPITLLTSNNDRIEKSGLLTVNE